MSKNNPDSPFAYFKGIIGVMFIFMVIIPIACTLAPVIILSPFIAGAGCVYGISILFESYAFLPWVIWIRVPISILGFFIGFVSLVLIGELITSLIDKHTRN